MGTIDMCRVIPELETIRAALAEELDYPAPLFPRLRVNYRTQGEGREALLALEAAIEELEKRR